MKCIFCDFETSYLNSDDVYVELERHVMDSHPEAGMDHKLVLSLLRIHCQFKVPVDVLISSFFEIRTKMGSELVRRDRYDPRGGYEK